MRNTILIVITFITIATLYSCKKCPEGIKRDDIRLTSNSESYIPNTISNSITYKDINNNLITLNTTGLVAMLNMEITDVPCSQPPIGATYNYVETETKELIYENSTIETKLRYYFGSHYDVDNPVEIDTNFVDMMYFIKNNKNNNSDFKACELITDLRAKQLTTYSDAAYQNSFVFHNTYMLVDSTFTNVYSDTNNELFYTKENGIVGFSDNGIAYRYKRAN